MEQEDKWLEMSYYIYKNDNMIQRLRDIELDILDILDIELEEND